MTDRFYIYKIKRQMKEERVTKGYGLKSRYIPKALYIELKNKQVCEKCGKKMKKKKRLEIHHIIPIKDGGSNTRQNLMAVCKTCHKKLDNKNESRRKARS